MRPLFVLVVVLLLLLLLLRLLRCFAGAGQLIGEARRFAAFG